MKVDKPAKNQTRQEPLNEYDFKLIEWIQCADLDQRLANFSKLAIILPTAGIGITGFYALTMGVEQAVMLAVCILILLAALGAVWAQYRAYLILQRLVSIVDLDDIRRRSLPLKPHE